MTKALIFDSETFDQEAVLAKVRYRFQDPLATIQVVETFDDFEKVLSMHGPWKMVVVNFLQPDFLDLKRDAIEDFVASVRNSQEDIFEFVGVTGSVYQNTILENLGLTITRKEYNGLHQVSTNKNHSPVLLPTKEIILRTVCDHYSVPTEKVLRRIRKGEVVKTRHTTAYLCVLFLNHKESLGEIGMFLGGRDHSTMIHSCNVVKDLMDTDPVYKGEIDILKEAVVAQTNDL